MNVITFLKNRRKEALLNKLDNLQKLSADYLQSADDCSKLINSNCSSYYCTCNFQNCYFNSFLDNTYHSNSFDIFYSNYMYFEHMHIITERKIKRIKKKLKAYIL